MKNLPTAVLILVIATASLTSCEYVTYKYGNGEIALQTLKVDPYREVSVSGNYEIFLEKADRPRVVIEADENIIDFITVEVRGGILSIYSEEKIKGSEGIKIFIEYTELESVTTGGASSLRSNDEIVADKFEVRMSGAGTIDVAVDVDYLKVGLSGAGVVKLKGRADDGNFNLSGAGSVEAFDLETRNCEITISGVGGAEVNVSGTLEARVSGLGGVEYMGEPEEIRREVSGIGKIKAARRPGR